MASTSDQEGPVALLRFKVSYRGKVHEVHLLEKQTLGELAVNLASLTGATLDTIKLILPKMKHPGRAAPTAVQPSSLDWHRVTLRDAGVAQGMSILMSGASAAEVDAVSKPSAPGVAGFDHEERRARMRSKRKKTQLPLPPGPYTFADFRAWQLPSKTLHPPEAKALKLMHRLASDPGVVAVMNKHKWRVGIMTELPPEGYVGVSPVCLLGFNRNRGMEISLRLRTDDLAGFRKYDSIRKTVLHELAHMVHDEHDEHFKALNSQLNREAEELDWTRKRVHTLGGKASAGNSSEEDWESSEEGNGKILGGRAAWLDPREAARSAALRRDAEMQRREVEGRSTADVADDVILDKGESSVEEESEESLKRKDAEAGGSEMQENAPSGDEAADGVSSMGPSSQDSEAGRAAVEGGQIVNAGSTSWSREQDSHIDEHKQSGSSSQDLDLVAIPLQGEDMQSGSAGNDEAEGHCVGEDMTVEEDLDAKGESSGTGNESSEDVSNVDNEWQHAQEAAAEASGRVRKAVAQLKQEAGPDRSALTLQTLATILRNIMEHPSEPKYRRVRKTNAAFFERVGRFNAALEVLHAAGFREEIGSDAIVLQRDDPGLLWLACSLVEGSLA